MSSTKTKVVYRVYLPELDGYLPRQAYKYFSNILGDADDLDDFAEEEYFTFLYKVPKNCKDTKTDFKNFVIPVTDFKGRWSVDVVLAEYNHDWEILVGLQPEIILGKGICLEGIPEELVKLGFPENAVGGGKGYAYTWYTGADEPIRFD